MSITRNIQQRPDCEALTTVFFLIKKKEIGLVSLKHNYVFGLQKTHMWACARFKLGVGAHTPKSVDVGVTQKVLPKQKVDRGQRENETKEQNGCLDTEDEEEEAESEGKLPHSYRHTTREPPLHSKDHLWLEMDVLCVFKNISVLILVPVEQAEHRGEKGRRRQA